MIPHTRQQWRVFLVWLSNPYQRKTGGNSESCPLVAVEMHCQTVISIAKASNKGFTFIYQEVWHLNLSIHAGLRYEVGRFYDQGREKNCPLGRLWPICWGMKYWD